ncbi:hypothetical protein PybrP1_002938 [[Pythium] brassicae (nom. inval.)]|nr:hypothetical protein PybrP1_002938 [[Pythium] brassicae (nom. inval.)]
MPPSVRSGALPTASSVSFSSQATRWRSHGESTEGNDDDDSDDAQLTRKMRLSDNHLLQLALEATQALDWAALARPPVATSTQAAWSAVKIKQPAAAATAASPTRIHTRVQGERVEVAAHTVVPCSLRELALVLEAASSAQFCDTMRLVHGDTLVAAELVHAVDTGTAAASELLVSAVTFARKPRRKDCDSSRSSLFSAWRQDDEWCFLDFVQHVSPRVVRKTLLSMAPSRLLVGKEALGTRKSSQQKQDVLAGYVFEELEGGRSTRVSFWGEHTLEQRGVGARSSGILSRALANRAGKARVLRLAESVDRYVLVVRRRRLGMQVMADEIKVLASNASCTCCSRSFLLARKRTCNLCGYYVCDKCSRLEERERRASLSGNGGGGGGGGSSGDSSNHLTVTHVRICEKCIARVDSCNFGNVSLEDLGPARIVADSPVSRALRANGAAPSTGALLTDLLQETLASVPEGNRSPVLSVIKHLVSLESPTTTTAAQPPKLFKLTDESSEQEHLDALGSRFAHVPRLSLPECTLANAEARSYLVEHGEDPNGSHPHPVPALEQRRLEIVRRGRLTELEDVQELDVICDLVSKELACMGALVSISEADTFRALTQSQFTVGKKLAEAASRILQQQLQTPSLSTSASQDGDNDLNDDEDVEDSTPSAARGGVYALVKPLVDGSVELRAFRTNSDANFCFQAPVVVTKSSTSPPNAVCPPKWAKLSCSRLAGDSAAQPLSVDLRLMYHTNKESASASQLVLTAPKSVLKSVEVVNIDLSSIDIAGGFLPASLTSISLQQCKIAALTPDFLAERHQTLQTLNLRGNPISSFSVSVDQFAQLASLVSFQVDAPAPRASSAMDTACSSGTLQSTAGVQFCVIRGGGAASSTPPGSSSSSGTFVALYIGVGIPVLVAVVTLVAFLTWKRRRTTSDVVDKADSFDISLLERTESPNSCVLEVDRSLLADPILAAHRLPFGDVAVGECISQGGFGVVYAGVYKSQRVAVKRIRAGQHRDESEVLRLVAAGALRPLLSPECPRGVALLAEHCLQREPERRPSSAHVAHFLARLLRAAGAVDAEGSGASVEAEGDSASPRSAMSVDSFFDESLLVRTATPQ